MSSVRVQWDRDNESPCEIGRLPHCAPCGNDALVSLVIPGGMSGKTLVKHEHFNVCQDHIGMAIVWSLVPAGG